MLFEGPADNAEYLHEQQLLEKMANAKRGNSAE